MRRRGGDELPVLELAGVEVDDRREARRVNHALDVILNLGREAHGVEGAAARAEQIEVRLRKARPEVRGKAAEPPRIRG